MFGSVARVVLFVSSYSPLLVLFGVLGSFGDGWPRVVCLAGAAGSALLLVVVWRMPGSSAADWVTLTSARSRDGDVMAYFASYVVPFAAAQSSDEKTRVALAVFVVLTGVLYVRAAIFYIHPLLLLVGLHVFAATSGADVPSIVLTRRRFLHQDERLWAITIAPHVYVERRQL